jgi:hypothetical protein
MQARRTVGLRACQPNGDLVRIRVVTPAFERFAGAAALGVALGALLYAALFVAIVEGAGKTTQELWFFLLMAGGLATVPVLVALFHVLRETDAGFALTALVLGLLAALGGIMHGGYNLGAKVTPPGGGLRANEEAVSHGVLRYLVAGLGFLVLAWLVQRNRRFPLVLAYVGYLGGAALVFIYIGRLYDFITPGDYFSLLPPLLYGFVLHPLWYTWVGLLLWRGLPAARA